MSEFFERVVYAMLEAEADLDPMSARTALIAALEALREFRPVFRCPHDGGLIHELRGSPEDIWQAMIDQAIKEGE